MQEGSSQRRVAAASAQPAIGHLAVGQTGIVVEAAQTEVVQTAVVQTAVARTAVARTEVARTEVGWVWALDLTRTLVAAALAASVAWGWNRDQAVVAMLDCY